MPTPDPFDELARKGREERDRKSSAELSSKQAAQKAIDRRVRRYGLMSTSPFHALIWPSVFIVPTPCMLLWFFVLKSPVFIAIGVGTTPLLLILTLVQGSLRYPREKTWLAAQRVPIEGHLEMLGFFDDHHGQSGTRTALRGVLELSEPAPADIVEVFRGFDPNLEVEAREDGKRLEFRCSGLLSDDGINQRYYRWIHRFVAELIEPLHARVGVKSLHLRTKR